MQTLIYVYDTMRHQVAHRDALTHLDFRSSLPETHVSHVVLFKDFLRTVPTFREHEAHV
jgi:hypothetical protein